MLKSRHCGTDSHQRRGKRQEGKKSEKSEEKERDRAQRMKHLTTSWGTNALIGDEEQNGKQKRIKRRKAGSGPQPNYPTALMRLCTLITEVVDE